MHGVKRSDETKKTAEEREASRLKAVKYGQLASILLAKHAKKEYTLENLELTGKMLRANPDFYSLWNFRRAILLDLYGQYGLLSSKSSSISTLKVVDDEAKDGVNMMNKRKISVDEGSEHSEIMQPLLIQEFKLSADGILKNSKSYGAWHHRQWIAERFTYNIQSELDLTSQFLQADERNFHCWIYRSFIVRDSEVSSSAEFEFSSLKIQENFSNYSAFHYRSFYIQQLFENNKDGTGEEEELQKEDEFQTLISSELEMIENAIFTEPDDQSAWWYHRFIISWAITKAKAQKSGSHGEIWIKALLDKEINMMRTLLEVEAICKWCLLSLSDMLWRRVVLCKGKEEALGGDIFDINADTLERSNIINELLRVDPMHQNRYLYLLSLDY
jgi:geranylgeranyl transferase type-2 subunit alpha